MDRSLVTQDMDKHTHTHTVFIPTLISRGNLGSPIKQMCLFLETLSMLTSEKYLFKHSKTQRR